MSTSDVISNAFKILFIEGESSLVALVEEPFEFSEERAESVLDEPADWFDWIKTHRRSGCPIL